MNKLLTIHSQIIRSHIICDLLIPALNTHRINQINLIITTNVIRNLILFFLLVSSTISTYAQWQQTLGPSRSTAYCVAFDDNRMFVGTYGNGLYISEDYGANWAVIDLGYDNLTVEDIVIDGTDIYVGTNSQGLFKSSDDGQTWNQINGDLSPAYIHNILIRNDSLFISNLNQGMFLSVNEGQDWVSINNGLPGSAQVSDLLEVGNDIYICTVYDGIYKTSDNGANWTDASNGLPTGHVNCIAAHEDGTLYSGLLFNGVYKSIDAGNNWVAANTGISNIEIKSLVIIGDSIIAGTSSEGMKVSVSEGSFWMNFNNGFVPTGVMALYENDNNFYAASIDNGLFARPFDANHWTDMNHGFPITTGINAVAHKDSCLFAGSWHGGVYVSSDDGKHWRSCNIGIESEEVQALITYGDYVFAGTDEKGVYRTENNGASWISINNGIPSGSSVSSFAVNDSFIFVGLDYGGIYKSSDYGNNWISINYGFNSNYVDAIATKGDSVYVGASYTVFFSPDNGASWEEIGNGLGYSEAIAINDSNIVLGVSGGAVYHTSNQGQTWNNISAGIGAFNFGDFQFYNDILYACVRGSQGLYMSKDVGQTWIGIGTNPSYEDITSLEIVGNSLYASTGGHGIIKRSLLLEASADTICEGDTTTLIVSPLLYSGTDIQYTWSNGMQGDTIRISLTANEDLTVTGVTSDSLFDMTEVSVIVKPNPYVCTYDRTICYGDSTTLSAYSNGVVEWHNGVEQDVLYLIMNDSIFYLTATHSNGCQLTDSSIVTVNPIPDTPYIIEESGVLTSSAPIGNQWYLNDTLIPGAIEQTLTEIEEGGSYFVIVALEGCSSDTSNLYNELIKNEILVYPNPATNHLVVKLKNNKSSNIKILDITGKEIYHNNFSNELNISTKKFNKGLYFIELNNSIIRKIIIE